MQYLEATVTSLSIIMSARVLIEWKVKFSDHLRPTGNLNFWEAEKSEESMLQQPTFTKNLSRAMLPHIKTTFL